MTWSEECIFLCSVFIFRSCCALPLPAQGLPECQQHLSNTFILTASKGLVLSAGWTLPAMPQRKCYCQKAFAQVSFLAVVGGRDTGTLATGEARQSTCFIHSSSCAFPYLPVQVFSNMGNGAWAVTWENVGFHWLPAFQDTLQLPAVTCQIQTWAWALPRGLSMRTACALCELSRSLAPQGQVTDALPQHKPFTTFPWALVNCGALSSFPAFKNKEKIGIKFYCHPCS